MAGTFHPFEDLLNAAAIGTGTSLQLAIAPYLHDGTSAGTDAMWNNARVTVQTYALNTATLNGSTQTNYNARGVMVMAEITTLIPTGTLGVTISLQAQDAELGAWVNLFVDGTVTATGTRTFIIYPGVGAATDGITAVRSYPLPRTWRMVVTPTTAGTFRVGIGASYIL